MKSLQYVRNGYLTIIKTIVLAFGLVLLSAVITRAGTVTIVGNGTGNQASATVSCSFDPATNEFTFTITNTSPFNATRRS